MRLHHVQVGIPAGGEEAGRRFYRDGLGLAEIDKPAELATRGGAWFRSEGGAEIHLGVEADPRPPERAHPALAVDSTAELEALAERLEASGFGVDWSQRYNTGRFERFHTRDPFGNRVEVVHEVTDR
ncbi:VOC family protein [Nocardioides panacihumi]|uniref:VOC family protein n=1 Tax=Nocardioides panacihumi TaxID=400774 RepID=A0ABN2QUC1_9ACTN